MIYLTGDTHGGIDSSKLNSKNFSDHKYLHKSDYLIILGDFGYIWNNDKSLAYWFKWFSKKEWTNLFIDGNHENFDLLNSYKIEYWNGGSIHRITDSIIHLMRGQIYNINNVSFYTFGGAHSVDYQYSKPGISWWKDEMPTTEEYQTGLDNLSINKNKVDYVLTHTAPSSVIKLFSSIDNQYYLTDELTDYFENVKNNTKYKKWFFGHFHQDNQFLENTFNCLYKEVIRIL